MARAAERVAPRQVGGAGDPDSLPAGELRRSGARLEPEGRLVQRQAVVLAGNAERLAEPARARAEETLVLEPPPAAHRLQAVGRLERADQHRVGDALGLADEVDAPMDPVGAVDVGVAGWAEHRSVPGGAAAVAVRGRVLMVVGLELDDLAADPVEEEGRADQLLCNLMHRTREEIGADQEFAALAS